MAILNYSTQIAPERTVGDITSLLIRKQARSITTDFDEAGDLTSISFLLPIGGLPVRFKLPANVNGVAAALLKENPWHNRRSEKTPALYDQKIRKRASWVAWRILKDWVEAQMALIESGQASAGQTFMPYAIASSDGRTMYELFVENNQRQLSDGGDHA